MDSVDFLDDQLPGRTATRDLATLQASQVMLAMSSVVMIGLANNGDLPGIKVTDIEGMTSHISYTLSLVLSSQKPDIIVGKIAMGNLKGYDTAAHNLAQCQLNVGSMFHRGDSSETDDTCGDQGEGMRAALAAIRESIGDVSRVDMELDLAKLSALHHGRQMIAQAHTHCVLSHLASQVHEQLTKTCKELSSWLKDSADGAERAEEISVIEQSAELWANQFLAASNWRPDDGLRRDVLKLHSELHDDLPAAVVSKLNRNAAMLACGLGPEGLGVRMDWSTVNDGASVRNEMLRGAEAFDLFTKDGLFTGSTHVPSLEGTSSAALVRSVRDTRQSLTKTFRDRYPEETLEARREEIRKNRSKKLQDRLLELKEFNADWAAKTSSIELGRTIIARNAQAVVGEQFARLWQYGWVPSLGELEKDIFEALQTDCQTTLATLFSIEAEADDGAGSLLSESTTAPETSSQKSKKGGKGKRKKKTRAASVTEAGPSDQQETQTLPPVEDLAARLASEPVIKGAEL